MRDLCRGTAVLATTLAALLVACWPRSSWGQQIVYVNNDQSPGNSVSALAVNPATGSLAPVPGSPFGTGGSGSFAPNIDGVDVVAVEHFLYATNSNPLVTNGGSVAAFSINDDGTLSTIPGSPFPTLGTKPNGLTVSNDETLLFVTNFQSNTVSVFDIETNGALTLVAGSPLSVASEPLGAMIDSPDALLFLSHSGLASVGVYSVGGGGSSLTPVAGSPFGAGGGERGLDVNAAHARLYVADGSNSSISGFAIGGGGALTAVPGSPVAVGAGSEPTDVLLHPSLGVLYLSDDALNNIDVYNIAGNGALTAVETVSSGGNGTAGMVIDAANNRLFAINGGSSATPSRDVTVFTIAPATGMLTAVAGSPFPTGVGSGRGSAIALATLPRSTCTDLTPALCSPGGGPLKTDCVSEWLVSTTPPPPVNPRTNLPLNRVICQNGNPGCDFDGSGTDDHCTFHVQVCLNNQDPHLPTCSPTNVASFELLRPRPGAALNDAADNANVVAFETAIGGKSCNNDPQTRSCLADTDCVAGGTCTNPPVVGVPFVHGKTPIIPPPPTPTPTPSSAPNICSNVMDITVPLRSTTSGFAAKSKLFMVKVRTSNARVLDLDMLTLTCLPAS
jgi:DNA-binding beta-propeller fold protein YncE